MPVPKKIPVISLFSGAMGLDLGLERAGFEVVLAVECDAQAVSTIKANRPKLPVIERKIEDVGAAEILKLSGQKIGGSFVVCGGPSCQSFSTAGQRRSLADPRGNLFSHFIRVVQETQPKFFIMENVRGMLSAAIRHRPLNKRGPGFPPLEPEEELGSAFRHIIGALRMLNYYTVFDVLNSADYGVPQTRERIFFIGARDGRPVVMPAATHARVAGEGRREWVTLKAAITEVAHDPKMSVRLAPKALRLMQMVPTGGNWKDLPLECQKEALGRAYDSWGGRSGFYRRLNWNKPSPALTTSPNSKATMLCHPTELRPLNIAEYAAIQQFPPDWKFCGTVTSQYRQIGNAVPIGLAAAVGRAVKDSWMRHAHWDMINLVQTHNDDLVRRMSQRPITFMNPERMRAPVVADPDCTWTQTIGRKREYASEFATEDE